MLDLKAGNTGKLRVAAHLWCMCGADLGETHDFVKCVCGMSYRLELEDWGVGSGWFCGTLGVVDDVRSDSVRYLELAREAETASAAFTGLFDDHGIPVAGVSRRVLISTKKIAEEARQREREFVRQLNKKAYG